MTEVTIAAMFARFGAWLEACDTAQKTRLVLRDFERSTRYCTADGRFHMMDGAVISSELRLAIEPGVRALQSRIAAQLERLERVEAAAAR